MKKFWIGFGILLVASIAVYGVVTQSNADSAQSLAVEKQIAVEKQSEGSCPFAKQTATASGCSVSVDQCPASKSECCESKQTATADGCCQSGEKTECSQKSDSTQPSEAGNQQSATAGSNS